MRILFAPTAWADYLFWQAHDPAMVSRINDLIRDTRRSPFQGIGKPEPLRGNLKGFWSRRLTSEHRLVYRVTGTGEDQALEILACRFHYRR
ncbi:Txe/YoeB family addiction module toxin [Enterovirga rhinocerotis]|uniref:Putative mRNA interferase YoeB n=1 Tax=Enterovirga rhinocerotis TaxID=1339210 RepID=A0A4R7BSX2_9HYPH|nr:Txe/YoeB family addiction module toxin [Enterovirga rhinocerotis]TDR87197.1 toxin YoeB [Enterovirga rhinocerotis]